jgi:hypothetical protein
LRATLGIQIFIFISNYHIALRRMQEADVQFSLVSSDRHESPGDVLNSVSREFDKLIGTVRIAANFEGYYEKWRVMIRKMPPSHWSIFKP